MLYTCPDTSNIYRRNHDKIYWAALHIFSGFRSSWGRFRYAVKPPKAAQEETTLWLGDQMRFRVFTHCVRGDWWVHERTTGILICDDVSRDKAIRKANQFLTLDASFGTEILAEGDVFRLPVKDPAEALIAQWQALHQAH